MNSALLTHGTFFDRAALFEAATLSWWKIKIASKCTEILSFKANKHTQVSLEFTHAVYTVDLIDLHTVWLYLRPKFASMSFCFSVGNARRFCASTSIQTKATDWH